MKYRLLIGIALASTMVNVAWADASALARDKGCMGCHGMDKKIVGPGFNEVAAKYKGDAAAAATLATSIKQGGSSNWGAVPMPPQASLSEAEINELVSWVLAQ